MDMIDTQKLKKKFGLLISKLYTDNNFAISDISEIICRNDYFDFLEEQKSKMFLDMSYEEIARQVFHAQSIFSNDTLTEFYWAGMMYITISLNKRIPLRQVMLLCPLEKMLSYFKIYHEMNDISLVNHVMQNDYRGSILKHLRNDHNLSTRQLSIITGIPEYTIKYYEKENVNLFNASFENITKISSALNVSLTFFYRKSRFVPISYVLFENKEIFAKLCDKLNLYFNKADGDYEFDGEMLYKIINKKREYINDQVLSFAILSSVDDYAKKDDLIF